MLGIVFSQNIRVVDNLPVPEPPGGWALIKVHLTGICRTDQEIFRGYMNFTGIPGHEFVGTVTACEDPAWIGRRVVGEITVACGICRLCREGRRGHCLDRQTLGIVGLNGTMAEYCVLPVANLHVVPDSLSNTEAVFVEPLAAAFQVLEQVCPAPSDRCCVLGDGKLGILCAWALRTVVADVTLVGHHPEKFPRMEFRDLNLRTVLPKPGSMDVVVEATGTGSGIQQAIELLRPRGTLVLKTTGVSSQNLNLTMAVVNELTIIGSRCGPFARTIAAMVEQRFPLGRLIERVFPASQGKEALEWAQRPGAMKVLIAFGKDSEYHSSNEHRPGE